MSEIEQLAEQLAAAGEERERLENESRVACEKVHAARVNYDQTWERFQAAISTVVKAARAKRQAETKPDATVEAPSAPFTRL